MKKIHVFLTAMLLSTAFSQHIYAQNNKLVSFTYDNNGNRTSLSVIVMRADENDLTDGGTNDNLETIYDASGFGSDTISGINVSIFPNPTSDYLILTTDSYEQVYVALLSTNGNTIYERTLSSCQTEFDLSDLTQGMYFLTITCNSERHVWKIVKM
jgi:hypothetical protein